MGKVLVAKRDETLLVEETILMAGEMVDILLESEDENDFW